MTTITSVRTSAPALRVPKDSIVHLDFVDALRGLAVLGVILFHSQEWVTGLPRAIGVVSSRGALGVPLFYMASAFTLFLSMEQRRTKDKHPTTAFFIRRFFRIAPMFWAAIVLYLLVDGFGPRYEAPYGIKGWQVAATTLFANVWHPEMTNGVVPGGWSVGIEMTFYCMLPLLFVWIKDLKRALIFLAVAVGIDFGAGTLLGGWVRGMYPAETRYIAEEYLRLWLPAQLHCFALGIVFYFLFRGIQARHRRASLGYLCLVGMVAAVPLGMFGGRVLAGVSLFLLVLGLALHPAQLLVNPVTRYIGKVSYSMYLLNFVAIVVASWALKRMHVTEAGGRGYAVLVLLAVLLDVGMATVTFYAIEEPGRKLGKRLLERIERQHLDRTSVNMSAEKVTVPMEAGIVEPLTTVSP